MTPAKNRENTPFEELRSLLDQADNRIGGLNTGTAGDALQLLRTLDRIETLYDDLLAADVDLRAEESRRETIVLGVQRKAGRVLRLLRSEGGIAAARAKHATDQSQWWWHLDEYVAQQRRKSLRSLATTGVILLVILAIATLLYKTVLAPDPLVIARMNHISDTQRAVESNDLPAALEAIEKGLAEFPADGELLLWRGAVLTRLNRPADAEETFAAARAVYGDEATFLIALSTIRLQVNDIAGAYADAKQATVIAPQNAQAFLALGGAQELRGEVSAASQSYSTAASLAAADGNTQLEAIAKVRMAMLMQTAPMMPNPTAPQPTP
jgi:cytochrome c-type biogenesis protein CcmH/NrfG